MRGASRWRLLVLVGLSLAGLRLLAQQAQDQPPRFRTSATLRTIDAIVTDRNGQPVTDLGPQDFEVVEHGNRQPLKQAVYVVLAARPSNATPTDDAAAALPAAPRFASKPQAITQTLAIVVDDLGLSFRSIVDIRNALHTFIDTQMQPGHLIAILRTSAGVGSLQQFTTDKRLLNAAAEQVQWSVYNRKGIEPFDAFDHDPTKASAQRDHPSSGGAIASPVDPGDTMDGLRERVLTVGSLGALEFAIHGLQRLPGRKSVIFFSEGFDLFDRKDRTAASIAKNRVLDSANRAGVVLYTVDTRGLQTGGLTAEDQLDEPNGEDSGRRNDLRASQATLHDLARQTGGVAILDTNDLTRGFTRALDDQRGYYLLGYDADHSEPDPETDQTDQIVVHVRRPGVHVRWRHGFFGPVSPSISPTSASDHASAGDPLASAAFSPFDASALTLRVTALFGHHPDTGSYVHVLFLIDAHDLTFQHAPDGGYQAQLDLLVAAVNASGQVAGVWRHTQPLQVTDADYPRLRDRGIVFSTKLLVREPGGYQIRAAVLDMATGRTGSGSQFVDVPRVGNGRLALSSVLMKGQSATPSPRTEAASAALLAARAEPTVRMFRPGSQAVYAYEIYAGLKRRDVDDLFTSCTLLHDGRVIYVSPASPVHIDDRDDKPLRVIPIGGTLSLARDLPMGRYSLQVTVARRTGTKTDVRAAQWVDFELR